MTLHEIAHTIVDFSTAVLMMFYAFMFASLYIEEQDRVFFILAFLHFLLAVTLYTFAING